MTTQLGYLNLIYELNAALDEGRHLPFDEVRSAAENNRLLELLREKLGDSVQNLELIGAELWPEINRTLAGIALGLHGRERRKFGVEKNGICLAIAYAWQAAANIYSETRDIVDVDYSRDIKP